LNSRTLRLRNGSRSSQYNIASAHGIEFFYNKQFREVLDPIPSRGEMLSDPNSIPLSVLNHPPGKAHEIDLAAYDPLELTLSPVEGAHPILGVYYGFLYDPLLTFDPMMKFTFTKGEGERTFVATGAHYRYYEYQDYEVGGSWGLPSEDGKIPVEFKITYKGLYWNDTELKGEFDPEENSLRGNLTELSYDFVFKRDPDYVRFLPSPSHIDARKRWKFALTSVLDRIRRQAWSPKRISQRIKDGKRFMELTLLAPYGRPPIGDQLDEFVALLPGLYEADARFYASLNQIKLSHIYSFDMVRCDKCSFAIAGSRIICLDCRGDTTLDLCSEPKCLNSTITFGTADRKPHSPSHGMIKTRRPIYDTKFGRVEEDARSMLPSLSGMVDKQLFACDFCKTTLSAPGWNCLDCSTGGFETWLFICDNCERQDLGFSQRHTKSHIILRIPKKEKKRSTEERLQFLEDKSAKIEDKLAGIEDKLMEIREIFAKFVEKSTEESRSDPVTGGEPHAVTTRSKLGLFIRGRA